MLSWETEADWDSPQSETGVHHEQPSGTDWAASDVLEKGYPVDWSLTSIPAPVAYWPLDEDSGTTATDVVGTYDGTVGGASPGSTGVLGTSAYTFDGSDDDVNSMAVSAIEGQTQFSVAAWVRLDSTTNSHSGNGMPIFEFGYRFDAENGIRYFGDSNNQFNFTIDDENNNNGNSGISSTTTYTTTGEWHHVVGTFNAPDVEIYVDGSSEGTATGTATQTTGSSSNPHHHIGGGAWNDKRSFNGAIGEVMVWDTELTSAHVSDLHNAALNGSDHWTSKQSELGERSTITVTSTTTIPANTSVTVTLFEDVGADGSGANTDALGNSYDNSASGTLSDGADQRVDLTGFDGGGSTNDYWFHIEPDGDGSDPTLDSPTVGSLQAATAGHGILTTASGSFRTTSDGAFEISLE